MSGFIALGVPFIVGYLIGSIPFGLILAKFAGHGDIRKIGSGNIGATNVLRTGDKKLALITLLLDIGKGAAAVLLAKYMSTFDGMMMAGLGAFLGHVFPVWLKFKGGKGVATTLGIITAIHLGLGIICGLLWFAVFLIFRISSLAALVAIGASPLVAAILFNNPVTSYTEADGSMVILFNHHAEYVPILCTLMAAIVFYKHKDNIKRLLKKEEPRVDFGKKNESGKT